jgi:hypothetical protein
MDLKVLSEELSEADAGDPAMIRKYGEGDTITIHNPRRPEVLWTWIGDYEWEFIDD